MEKVDGKIYKITNLINGKVYIGQTIRSVKKRWTNHKHDSLVKRYNSPLHNSIAKRGIDNFTIELIDTASSATELDDKEIYYIAQLNSRTPNGYNIREGGNIPIPLEYRANKCVIDILTNQRWISAIECSKDLNIPVSRLRSWLRGDRGNPTNLRYLGFEDVYKIPKSMKPKKAKKKKLTSEEYSQLMSPVNKKIACKRFYKEFLCYKDGKLIGSWGLKREASKFLNIHESGISAVLLGRIKQYHGYTFRYAEGK